MARALIIVESPAKARTIARYLGPGYEVESSIGHIRDLPSSAAEIPARYKSAPWARLGVDVDADFRPLYVVPPGKKAQVKKLRDKLRTADALYLATDEDREGEAIAWHLVAELKPSCPVRRMVFHEITRSAIEHAIEAPRDIDERLVGAQEARRILDRLVGYEVSPLLWKKVKSGLSAGRVQSVATRLVVARETARMRFVEAAYCGLDATLEAPERGELMARLAELDGRRVATGKDFDPDRGELKGGNVVVLDGDRAERLRTVLEGAEFIVTEVSEKPFSARPYPPFMTSTLQQEAGRKLRLNAQRTMRLAQSLYENGYITYMRTDSVQLSHEAVEASRRQIAELYGAALLPDRPRHYTSKSKNAQEAHEAIRPAGETFRTPQSLRGVLESDQLRLYELIWKRTLASQMKDAAGRRTAVRIEADGGDEGRAAFSAAGKVIDFPGFLRAYVEGSDDPQAELADQERELPPLRQGESLTLGQLETTRHTTQPPPRYTEASLVKELETRGIGRPSTYAAIIQTIQDRGYVFHKGPALVPTFVAFAVTRLLERHLPDLVDYDFTAAMEDELDTIARGEREPVPWLREFYFGGETANGERTLIRVGLQKLIETSGREISPQEVSRIRIGETEAGEEVSVRIGRYGAFVEIGNDDRRATVPDDTVPDELTVAAALALVERSGQGARALGLDPATGKPVYLKDGRFGPYVQLGDAERGNGGALKKGGKPKMASLWKGMDPAAVDLETALLLLSFPREIGRHPDTGAPIIAQDGRFGPYLKMGEETRSLGSQDRLATVTLDEAVELFRRPKPRGRGAQPAVIGELGPHPATGAALQVRTGRFGPYVTDGTLNATIPKKEDPAALTVERAVELLEARAAKVAAGGGSRPQRPPRRRKAT